MHLISRLLVLAFLILPTLTPTSFMVQGGQLSRRTDAATKMNGEKYVKMRGVIGSKPPRCDERCKSCGQCEAVQVPIKKFFVQETGKHQFYANIEYYREGGISNYKPMCWKCKCGDFIFNPW